MAISTDAVIDFFGSLTALGNTTSTVANDAFSDGTNDLTAWTNSDDERVGRPFSPPAGRTHAYCTRIVTGTLKRARATSTYRVVWVLFREILNTNYDFRRDSGRDA